MARTEQNLTLDKASELPCVDHDVLPSRKRRRSVRSSPSDTKSKTDNCKTGPPKSRRRKLENPEAGPSETIATLLDPSELLSRNLKAPASETSESLLLKNARPSLPGAAIDIVGAEAQLRMLKQNLRDAENQLRQERGQRAQQELKIRQDMYLEMFQAKQSSQREIEKLDIHLRMASKLIDEKNQALQELQRKFETTSESLNKHVVELDFHKRELQHLQHVNTTLEADIEELRQIHNEAAARKRPPGLPPAYGSLDEEDMPPYELHADSGALNVATLKRVARENYDKNLQEIGASDAQDPLAIELSASTGVRTFYKTSKALYEAASSIIRAWHDLEPEMTVDVNAKHEGTVRKVAAKHTFTTSRAANTILELAWRTVALNEIRPAIRNFSPRALAELQAIYSHVDDVLVELLRKWNGECRSNANHNSSSSSEHGNVSRAAEFQVYLSQLTALRTSLLELVRGSVSEWRGEFFGKSEAFLLEAVEIERMQEANADADGDAGTAFRRESAMPWEDANEAFHREGSVVSSVGVANEESGGEVN